MFAVRLCEFAVNPLAMGHFGVEFLARADAYRGLGADACDCTV